METWLIWARGPLFIAAMVVLILGLLRVFALNIASIWTLYRRSRESGRSVSWTAVIAGGIKSLIPVRLGQGNGSRGIFSLTSIAFHVGIIVTPLFLGAHIQLWNRGLGLSWPALGAAAADWLSLLAVATALLLFVMRVGSREARAISRPQDYIWPLLIAVPFITGLLAMHPTYNPFSYDAVMLAHVLSGDLILFLIPVTKIGHVVLIPTSSLLSELGWQLKLGSGQEVAAALGKEDEPI